VLLCLASGWLASWLAFGWMADWIAGWVGSWIALNGGYSILRCAQRAELAEFVCEAAESGSEAFLALLVGCVLAGIVDVRVFLVA
jgi:uncharacterized membrane protein YeaQ/YmgE (transglycosylase-associated protein family)